MPGFTAKLVLAGAVVGVVLSGRIHAGQQSPAPAPQPAPTLPQFQPPPRLMPPVQIAPAPRPQWQLPVNPLPWPPDGRPPLPEVMVDPYVVCGMTILPAPPNVDPGMVKQKPSGLAQFQMRPYLRRVAPPVCANADARP
jgi:hypothetical protein